MDNQITFWNTNDTQEHLTLFFSADGTILHLTRDETRSVSKEWNEIGTWSNSDHMRIIFDTHVPHLWTAATQMNLKGATVYGSSLWLNASVTSRETSDVTDPDTLMGRERKRSLSLGDTAKGERGARKFGGRCKLLVDVSAMRRAIAARK